MKCSLISKPRMIDKRISVFLDKDFKILKKKLVLKDFTRHSSYQPPCPACSGHLQNQLKPPNQYLRKTGGLFFKKPEAACQFHSSCTFSKHNKNNYQNSAVFKPLLRKQKKIQKSSKAQSQYNQKQQSELSHYYNSNSRSSFSRKFPELLKNKAKLQQKLKIGQNIALFQKFSSQNNRQPHRKGHAKHSQNQKQHEAFLKTIIKQRKNKLKQLQDEMSVLYSHVGGMVNRYISNEKKKKYKSIAEQQNESQEDQINQESQQQDLNEESINQSQLSFEEEEDFQSPNFGQIFEPVISTDDLGFQNQRKEKLLLVIKDINQNMNDQAAEFIKKKLQIYGVDKLDNSLIKNYIRYLKNLVKKGLKPNAKRYKISKTIESMLTQIRDKVVQLNIGRKQLYQIICSLQKLMGNQQGQQYRPAQKVQKSQSSKGSKKRLKRRRLKKIKPKQKQNQQQTEHIAHNSQEQNRLKNDTRNSSINIPTNLKLKKITKTSLNTAKAVTKNSNLQSKFTVEEENQIQNGGSTHYRQALNKNFQFILKQVGLQSKFSSIDLKQGGSLKKVKEVFVKFFEVSKERNYDFKQEEVQFRNHLQSLLMRKQNSQLLSQNIQVDLSREKHSDCDKEFYFQTQMIPPYISTLKQDLTDTQQVANQSLPIDMQYCSLYDHKEKMRREQFDQITRRLIEKFKKN